jgi:hypothetical protein
MSDSDKESSIDTDNSEQLDQILDDIYNATHYDEDYPIQDSSTDDSIQVSQVIKDLHNDDSQHKNKKSKIEWIDLTFGEKDDEPVQYIKKGKVEYNTYLKQKELIEKNKEQIHSLKKQQSEIVKNNMQIQFTILKNMAPFILKGNYYVQKAFYAFISSNWLSRGIEKTQRHLSASLKKEFVLFLKQELQLAYNQNGKDINGNFRLLDAMITHYNENIDDAIKIYRKSADLGNRVANFIVLSYAKNRSSSLYVYGTEDPYQHKITEYEKLSSFGDREASFQLGRCHEYGKKKNIRSAIQFYRKAAEDSHEDSIKKIIYLQRRHPKLIDKNYAENLKKNLPNIKYEIPNFNIFDLFGKYKQECNILVLFFAGREKNPDSPFHKNIFPLDLLKIIVEMANICHIASFK